MSLVSLDEMKGRRATTRRAVDTGFGDRTFGGIVDTAPVVAAPRILTRSAPAPAPISRAAPAAQPVLKPSAHPVLKSYGVESDPDWIWRANNYSAEDLRGLLDKMVPKPAPEVKPVSWLSSGLQKLGISKGVQRAVTGAVVPAPLNAAANAIAPLFGGGRGAPSFAAQPAPFLPGAAVAVGRIGGLIGRVGGAVGRVARSPAGRAAGVGAAGAAGWEIGQRAAQRIIGVDEDGNPVFGARRRRMNFLNQRALSRANRRVCGFSNIARRTLKDLGYTVSATRKGTKCKGKKRRSCR